MRKFWPPADSRPSISSGDALVCSPPPNLKMTLFSSGPILATTDFPCRNQNRANPKFVLLQFHGASRLLKPIGRARANMPSRQPLNIGNTHLRPRRVTSASLFLAHEPGRPTNRLPE